MFKKPSPLFRKTYLASKRAYPAKLSENIFQQLQSEAVTADFQKLHYYLNKKSPGFQVLKNPRD